MKVAGVILCGGQSSRMGSPKALLKFEGKSFLERTSDVIGETCCALAWVAARDQEIPEIGRNDLTVLRDSADAQGPMAGLLVALEYFASTADAVYLSSCDVPLLKKEVVARICAALGDFDVVIPRIEGRLQPLAAVYATRLYSKVKENFDLGRRRLTDLLPKLGVRELTKSDFADIDPTGESFRNVNTPEDYLLLVAEAQFRLTGGNTGLP